MRPRNRDAADTFGLFRDSSDEDRRDAGGKLHRKKPPIRIMLGRWRKWAVLVAAIWIQASTGTNFDFAAYSSDLKSVLGLSQVRLNYLAVASDLGKAFGWSSGLAVANFPLSAILFAAATMGFVGYGVQWLVVTNSITLPYLLVFLCCLLAGLSICWFNTVCFILCIRHFPNHRPLALSLTVSFNGVSAALYSLAFNAVNPSSPIIYLLLNSFIPLIVSIISLPPVLAKPSSDTSQDSETCQQDSRVFVVLNVLAVLTSFYLLVSNSSAYFAESARLHFLGAIFLLVFPLCAPLLVYARDYFLPSINYRFHIDNSGYVMLNMDELKIDKGFVPHETRYESTVGNAPTNWNASQKNLKEGNDMVRLGDEHSFGLLIRRIEFWLYYAAYFCGGTIGLVYSNNLGQIAQSLGQSSNATTLVTIYSSFSFFGRLLSAAPDFTRKKFRLTRTGWFTIALLPTPIAFFLLASSSGQEMAVQTATALIGLSSGFIFAAAVSITSELFGPNSVGLNHNILITNIPIGSLVYGYLSASVYEANARPKIRQVISDSVVCLGRQCYFKTFVLWGCFSVLGLVSSLLLCIRTRSVYRRIEQFRVSTASL
ncbi:PREDICTED: protein NUCLEAR FUSION DEFECTIVE 4 [Tarenaya hassleriana]|uniref:protein NUCLEAR FUSION DEFECTIVE 4 n=1 Tax=Tarenaya hassleriana TaxID=28532 RepID=UPI00053C1456|nr:PREDICTED: protein NUCLEAR FUSION DEFECTIVE 4 [Tarenaya hassleriana]